MSCGFLIFAYDNDAIDYGTLALCNALLIKKHCTVNNVAVVTSSATFQSLILQHGEPLIRTAFDTVIINEIDTDGSNYRTFSDTRYKNFTVKYHNSNRTSAYELSPFDETLLLDADYLILDNSTDLIWGTIEPILCNNTTVNLDHIKNYGTSNGKLNQMGIPLYWATAVYFKKTIDAQLMFAQMQFIKENYYYYTKLYGFNPNVFFRNDYAISIALHIMSGFIEPHTVKPLPVDYILVSEDTDEFHMFYNGTAIITTEHGQGNIIAHSVQSNVHMMNKLAVIRQKDSIIKYATT